jgi:class 3 adenylate cyclase/tetratricopeptide (TPR) repeat protein
MNRTKASSRLSPHLLILRKRHVCKRKKKVRTAENNQKPAAIMFVDVVESVRHLQRDEWGAVERMRSLLEKSMVLVSQHRGQTVERLGDGLFLRFEQVRDAVLCAKALHQMAQLEKLNNSSLEELQLRAGLHYAVVKTEVSGLYGFGVNLAARIAAMGEAGDTLLSAAARDQISVGFDADVSDLGLCYLKHIDEPVRVFRLQALQPISSDLRQAIALRMKTRPILAIMPFVLRSQGMLSQSATSLSGIISQQLTTVLSRSRLLHVISGLSSKALLGAELSLTSIYQALGADYVLIGQVDCADVHTPALASIQVHFQLWRSGSSEPLLDESVRASPSDALSQNSDLLCQLATSTCQSLLRVEQRLALGAAALPNLASHTLYLNAVDLLHKFSVQDFDRAGQMLLALSERAPRHADPWAWLARWHVFRVVQGWTDNSARDSAQALHCSERALERDPESPLALTMAGSVHAGVKRDPATAQKLYQQALEHNPNESMAWVMSGVAQGFLSAPQAALAASETALGLAPIDPLRCYYDSLSASAALFSGETARALELAQRAVKVNTGHGSAYRVLATAHIFMGQIDAARLAMGQMLAVEPHFTVQMYRHRVGVETPMTLEIERALRLAGLPDR